MKNNCINCGAPLNINGNKVIKCDYCGTEYNIDPLTNKISEYMIELTIMGKKRKFYIGDLTLNKIYGDCYRNLDGSIHQHLISKKIKMNLIEM